MGVVTIKKYANQSNNLFIQSSFYKKIPHFQELLLELTYGDQLIQDYRNLSLKAPEDIVFWSSFRAYNPIFSFLQEEPQSKGSAFLHVFEE